jgi:hypothetical protein
MKGPRYVFIVTVCAFIMSGFALCATISSAFAMPQQARECTCPSTDKLCVPKGGFCVAQRPGDVARDVVTYTGCQLVGTRCVPTGEQRVPFHSLVPPGPLSQDLSKGICGAPDRLLRCSPVQTVPHITGCRKKGAGCVPVTQSKSEPCILNPGVDGYEITRNECGGNNDNGSCSQAFCYGRKVLASNGCVPDPTAEELRNGCSFKLKATPTPVPVVTGTAVYSE